MTLRNIVFAVIALVFATASAPAISADLAFTASLRGNVETSNTGSSATGEAKLVVHTDKQTVDISLKVSGISRADFAVHLAHAPVGPMHLHLYAPNGDVSLLLPFPMAPDYTPTADGFTYTRAGFAYAEGAKILGSAVTFDDFVAAMKSGKVVFNIHTNKFAEGEISGTVKSAP